MIKDGALVQLTVDCYQSEGNEERQHASPRVSSEKGEAQIRVMGYPLSPAEKYFQYFCTIN